MNKIYVGNFNINKAYLGSDLTIKIYLGDNLVYPIEDSVAITFYDESGNTATINCDDLSQSGRIGYSDTESFIGTSYTSAVVGDCVTIIGGYSLPYQLTSLTLSDSVEELEPNDSVPQNCVTLVCGTGLTTVGGYCMEYRTSIQSVTFNGTVPPTFNRNWESESNKTFIIYVPCNAIEAYRTALSGKTANLNDRLQCIPTPSYESKYLTIESQANNNQISFSNNIQYSVDNGSTWTTLATGNTVSLNSGDTAMFKASGITPTGADGIGHFSSTDSYKVYGNVMSLVYGDNFSGQTTMSDYQFIGLFCTSTVLQNSGLTDASNLVLPATTLTDFCYFRMFENCVNLTAAPELPSTSLDFACYAEMFQGCSSLLAAPSLPATTLANECYEEMFFGCSSLTAAPQLPASVMTNQCYKGMFGGCTSLTSAPVLSSTTLANQCYEAMFQNCSGLTSAPVLPATTMAASAYTYMFEGCTSLTTPPSLPATTLADWCYRSMFEGCTSLTTAPSLPATTLTTACYCAMFFGCTSLTTAPDLSASTLVDRCYRDMFYGCSDLNYIKCLATSGFNADYCTTNWVYGVQPLGVFVKDSNTTWATGVDGIPSKWIVDDDWDSGE